MTQTDVRGKYPVQIRLEPADYQALRYIAYKQDKTVPGLLKSLALEKVKEQAKPDKEE